MRKTKNVLNNYCSASMGYLCVLVIAAFSPFAAFCAEGKEDQNALWVAANVDVRPVLPDNYNKHNIHAYFNVSPESPDGKYIVFFSSDTKDGSTGDVCIMQRASGKITTLVKGLTTEDAHRSACQQWTDNGTKIAYHDCVKGKWQVCVVDVATGKTKVLAKDRQLGFGSPVVSEVPIYGCHWNPGEHRNLEMVDVNTGVIRKAVDINDVTAKYGDWIEKKLGGLDVSVFFPVVSPDGKRVFFKIARGNGGNSYKGRRVSKRDGMVVYDLQKNEFVRFIQKWGHPAWAHDGSGIIEKGNYQISLDTGKSERYARQPKGELNMPCDHPSLSPDGKYFVTDADVSKREGYNRGEWAISVARTTLKSNYECIAHFMNNKGALSWRRCHPHPVFSADGKRIYFNVSDGKWTRLFVAELKENK